jgi:hypothetical protein
MIRTVEAVVDPSGNIRVLEDIQLSGHGERSSPSSTTRHEAKRPRS